MFSAVVTLFVVVFTMFVSSTKYGLSVLAKLYCCSVLFTIPDANRSPSQSCVFIVTYPSIIRLFIVWFVPVAFV